MNYIYHYLHYRHHRMMKKCIQIMQWLVTIIKKSNHLKIFAVENEVKSASESQSQNNVDNTQMQHER